MLREHLHAAYSGKAGPWALGQEHWHYLGASRDADSQQSLSPCRLISICIFNKITRLLAYTLKFKRHWFRQFAGWNKLVMQKKVIFFKCKVSRFNLNFCKILSWTIRKIVILLVQESHTRNYFLASDYLCCIMNWNPCTKHMNQVSMIKMYLRRVETNVVSSSN